MKFYHASPKKFKPGDVIGRHGLAIFMTQSPEPHYTIIKEAVYANWNVYEVLPVSKVMIGKCWDEAISVQVEVIKRVGNARGIANNYHKNFKSEYRLHKGSQVFWKRYVPPRRKK